MNRIDSYFAPVKKESGQNETSILKALNTSTFNPTLEFKMQEFRGIQQQVIEWTLQKKDCLVLMPTGGGKSLTYQLPAAVDAGVTLVVSPLLALIQNQVEALQKLSIEAKTLNSAIKKSERTKIIADLESKKPLTKLLYITPELLATENFQQLLFSIEKRGFLSRLVIDEAHCISEWGHDFRHDYRKLEFFKKNFPHLPVMALTATATHKVQKDILETLGIKNAQIFKSSFDRPNLHYEVRLKKDGDAYADILKFLKTIYKNREKRLEDSNERVEGVCGIIYCSTRADCDSISKRLEKDGVKAKSYHAGLSNKSRKQILSTWTGTTSLSENDKDLIDVVVATISFGMGIDKKDVRFVIHYDMPQTLEGYYQESGRAGRDFKLSRCILYYSRQDRDRITWLLSMNNQVPRNAESFNQLIKYCENSQICRHRFLLKYFGETVPTSATCPEKRCDICKNPQKVKEMVKELDDFVPKNDFYDENVSRLADGSLVRKRPLDNNTPKDSMGFTKASSMFQLGKSKVFIVPKKE